MFKDSNHLAHSQISRLSHSIGLPHVGRRSQFRRNTSFSLSATLPPNPHSYIF